MTHYLAELVAPLDALLLKGDGDPETRAIMSAALVLDGTPDLSVLAQTFERASRSVPRMRQRVTSGGWARNRQSWVPDEAFDAADHIRQVGAPGDASLGAVLELASSAATAPFDPAKPLWDATVVTGVEGGQTVLVLRVHHAIADGVRALHMMANLLDLEPDPAREELAALEQRGSRIRIAGERWVRTTSQVLATRQRRTDSVVRFMVDASWRPAGAVSRASRYARSVIRTYGSGGAQGSPLLRSRSRARRFATIEMPLDQVRTVGADHGATVNDVFIAGLIGGLRTYQRTLGEEAVDLPVAFPINIAADESAESGNYFSAGVIPGPCSVDDPFQRLTAVHDLVAARRDEPGVDAPLRLAPLLHQVPPRLATTALNAYAARVDLQASNIIGPDCAVYLAGAHVSRFYAFGPLPGIPVMVVLVSYEGVCTLGFTIDPAAVSDRALLLSSVVDALVELGVADAVLSGG
ncbi:hypothetical protein ASG49_00395 [Marmoricola sp. Leaf446]|uniref:wax ester/triacylglycerol synthase domain-containing protein n=1 Tax=Marmoricola sp. Leaf446 TaxID=1736379 RepID=UPI00070105BB|nr:wax ester/triacylglycerol synthase domain-containing protein [Marmoricola sp. Leaf446]KQT93516.1 hypothetical protein ASG49_00395 [Marmoricola sp. Leaf446]